MKGSMKPIVKEAETSHEAALSRFTPIIERAPLPIVEVQGEDHRIAYVNKAFCQLLGTARHEVLGKSFDEITPAGHDCMTVLSQVYETGFPASHEAPGDDVDSEQWLYAMWPSLDADARRVGVIIQMSRAESFRQNAVAIGEALLLSAIHQHELNARSVRLNAELEEQIAIRKRAEAALHEANEKLSHEAVYLEKQVAERTHALSETVAELEGFSYSIAHDMRAPLVSMQGFASILLDDYRGCLDAVAIDYLERIANSASRMNRLIQDALNYTRVQEGDAALEPVDLSRFVPALIGGYPDFQSPKMHIQIEGRLPTVLGHEGFLTQCISNLLSNAAKFVAAGVTPTVRIWSSETPDVSTESSLGFSAAVAATGDTGRVRVWFEDNGIGVAAKDRARVFRMFDRINPPEEFGGTGVGMAIVRKAVHRMGGAIDFESTPGCGSKFWIDLKGAARRVPTVTTQ
jgi:signal transduction histidine kinase